MEIRSTKSDVTSQVSLKSFVFPKTRTSKSADNNVSTPEYKVKHINNVSLQDCSNLNKSSPMCLCPDALKIEFKLPNIFKASEIDIKVGLFGKSLSLETSGFYKYHADIVFDYAIEDEPQTAWFNISTCILELSFLTLKKEFISLSVSPPSSADSGIESEHGYRTSSDGDNSSVSSHEESFECDKLKIFEKSKSASKLFNYMASFTFYQTIDEVLLTIPNVNVGSDVYIVMPDNQTASLQYTSIGEGLTPVSYDIIIFVKPYCIKEDGVIYHTEEDALIVRVRKDEPQSWNSINIGSHFDDLEEIKLEEVEDYELAKRNIFDDEDKVKFSIGSVDSCDSNVLKYKESEGNSDAFVQMKSDRLRRLSESSVTCSWPRGILKGRSFSFSESLDIGSPSSFEDKGTSEDSNEKDGEGSCEDVEFPKKSVRFSDIVSKQVFRYGSSILGQRAKNQRRALNKKRSKRERRSSESDIRVKDIEDGDNSLVLSDPGNYDNTTTEGSNDESIENDNTSRIKEFLKVSESSIKKVNKKLKGRKHRKKINVSVELSNDMIFQLDDA